MGWSVRWSIQGSIITFTDTLSNIEIGAIDFVEPLSVSKRGKAYTRLIHRWTFRILPPIDQKMICGHFFFLDFNLRPDFKSQGARSAVI
jgi:hypothetical protein